MPQQLVTIDIELVRDILGLIRLRCGDDNARAALAMVGALRVMHEASGKLEIEKTAKEISHAFRNVDLGKLGREKAN